MSEYPVHQLDDSGLNEPADLAQKSHDRVAFEKGQGEKFGREAGARTFTATNYPMTQIQDLLGVDGTTTVRSHDMEAFGLAGSLVACECSSRYIQVGTLNFGVVRQRYKCDAVTVDQCGPHILRIQNRAQQDSERDGVQRGRGDAEQRVALVRVGSRLAAGVLRTESYTRSLSLAPFSSRVYC